MEDPLAEEKREAAEQRCPRCGAAAAIPIMFGLPGADLGLASLEGEVVLGGCLINGGEPRWACRECGERWNSWPMRPGWRDAAPAWTWEAVGDGMAPIVREEDLDAFFILRNDEHILARVYRPVGDAFIAEILTSDPAELTALCKELDFYITDVGGPDPWAYAIYHCRTASNVYSKIHWGYHPVEHPEST